MKLDIKDSDRLTVIEFKMKDLTDINEIISIGCAISRKYCFEADVLTSAEFEDFIEKLKPRKTYQIFIGLTQDDMAVVSWGMKDSKLTGGQYDYPL